MVRCRSYGRRRRLASRDLGEKDPVTEPPGRREVGRHPPHSPAVLYFFF